MTLKCYWTRIIITVCFALVMFTVATQALTHDFYFDPHPRDQDVVEGDDVLLRCDVSNRNHITFRWDFNGKRLVNDSRRFMEDSDLRILSTEGYKDSGVFSCTATNVTTGISARSRGATLNIICEYCPQITKYVCTNV